MKYKLFNLKILIILFFAIFITKETFPCTTAVISGKYTKDGRPMLWKNRDTHAINNSLMYFDDGKYSYVGLVNSHDKKKSSVWIGMNRTGFAIMNSASYNLNLNSDADNVGTEGRIMKDALSSCKTIEDFEAYLNNIKKPSGQEANFGVIDAYGGAAYYEFGHEGYVKFDANDPKVAPFGYLIRSNYSFSGKLGKESSGYIRYHTVDQLFYQKASTVGLTPKDIEQNLTKSLYNSLTKRDLYKIYGDLPENSPQYEILKDYIPRIGSSSSSVIQGIKTGENPNLITMWTNVGFPLASIMVPVWIEGANELPYVVKYNEKFNDSPICYAALKLKNEKILNIRWGKFASSYIDINALFNKNESGITQIITKKENEIYSKANSLQSKMRNRGSANKKEIEEFYKWVNQYVIDSYKEEFKIYLN
ncbi:MAG: hypothetical protein IMY72_03620 [Bacteroidetes bacterium]|nr:hypothetical protein [Bacteroidota bacterium]